MQPGYADFRDTFNTQGMTERESLWCPAPGKSISEIWGEKGPQESDVGWVAARMGGAGVSSCYGWEGQPGARR